MTEGYYTRTLTPMYPVQCTIYEDDIQKRPSILHLLILQIDLFRREISHLDPIRPNKHTILRKTSEIPFALNPAFNSRKNQHQHHHQHRCQHQGQQHRHQQKQNKQTHDPSFFPIGSSYSTPTQTPPLLPNFVVPTYLTVPLLWKPSSEDSTWQREPSGIVGRDVGAGVEAGSAEEVGEEEEEGSAKRPTL